MSEQSITVTVAYGSTKHNITLTTHDETGPFVKDLSDALTAATGVPQTSQKIIFKGKSLKDMEERLTSYGVKEGCKLMMIGKRNSPEEEAELKKLKDIEKSVEQTAKKLEKVGGELTGLKNVSKVLCFLINSSVPNVFLFVHVSNSPALNTQGFLAKDLQVEALGKLDHRVKTAAEQLMKTLEQIDALSVPENFSDCRMKKKGLVKTVQGFLAECDKIEACISDHLSKIQSKNLALAD
ncbi:BAG family molecular chaperone regulator 1 isoform X2 [Takifugu flavidus]|uniref:BAG family molecular chaperone regulator 1 isoform X2 n=1 Tax=Takifugu flavidus TaxID=433684 RepID=UPI0025441277|nr:BAG family molecular chaperone regulator 1 isoform X2 [Takifugu flavidus]